MATLGSIIIGGNRKETILEMVANLKPEEFYREANGRIFDAAMHLLRRGIEVDVVTLSEELSKRAQLDECGGILYLMQLAEYVPTPSSLAHYRKIVQEKATLRKIIEFASEAAGLAYAQEESDDILTKLESVMRDTREGKSTGKGAVRLLRDIVADEMDMIDERYHNRLSGTQNLGIMTGLTDLDMYLTGAKPGQLIVIAARPSNGKSALAATIVRAAGEQGGVLFASLEMSESELAQRFLSGEAEIDSYALKTGALENEDWQALQRAMNQMYDLPIYVSVCPSAQVAMLASRAKRIKNLGCVVVDYFQLMQGDGSKGDRRVLLEQISRDLKSMAVELDVPVFVLSQLSREVDKREDKRPQLSDLREAAIENEADAVLFIYRPFYYMKDKTGFNPMKPDKAEIIVAKNRNGPLGTAIAGFIAAQTKFVDWEDPLDFPSTHPSTQERPNPQLELPDETMKWADSD